MSADMTPRLFVYAGIRFNAKERAAALHLVIDGKPDQHAHLFVAKKGLAHLVVGGVYEIDAAEDLATIIPKARWLSSYAGPELLDWKARDIAERGRADAARNEAAAKRVDALAALLAPFRREYTRTSETGRAALEIALLRALRRPLH